MKSPPDIATILELEKEAASIGTKSFWDVAVPFYSANDSLEVKSKLDDRGDCSGKSAKPGHTNVVVAGLILILSVLIGYVLLMLKG